MNVTVDQTLESISVAPGSVIVVAGASQQFRARALDQFGDAMAVPSGLVWSIVGGIGTVDPASGLYNAPDIGGSAFVKASSGSVSGTADVVVSPINTPPPTSGPLHARAIFREIGHSKTGFLATITLTNMGMTPIVGWSLQFDFARESRS